MTVLIQHIFPKIITFVTMCAINSIIHNKSLKHKFVSICNWNFVFQVLKLTAVLSATSPGQ